MSGHWLFRTSVPHLSGSEDVRRTVATFSGLTLWYTTLEPGS